MLDSYRLAKSVARMSDFIFEKDHIHEIKMMSDCGKKFVSLDGLGSLVR